MIDNKHSKIQRFAFKISLLLVLIGSFVAQAKQSEFTWLDVSKSEWIVSGKIEDVTKIEGTDFFELILNDVSFIKGTPYKRATKIVIESDVMNSINLDEIKRVILFLNYNRTYQSMGLVDSSSVITESENILNELSTMVVQENEIVMSWTGFNEPSSLKTPRSVILEAIDGLYHEDTFDKGVNTLFNLPDSDYEYLIYEMYNLDTVAKYTILENMLPKNLKTEQKYCNVTSVFDTVNCILELKFGVTPYPSYSSSSAIEGRWLKFKGWLIYSWYSFKG